MPARDEGTDGFIAGLKRCGCAPERRAGVIVFAIVAAGGARAGVTTDTGVSIDELGSWPAVPPHWVHLPDSVKFERTNTQDSSISGWVKHSRQPKNWGNAEEPSQAWLAHVRGMLEEAV